MTLSKLTPVAFCAVALLGLSACDHNNRTGDMESHPTVGQSVGNATDNAVKGTTDAGHSVAKTFNAN